MRTATILNGYEGFDRHERVQFFNSLAIGMAAMRCKPIESRPEKYSEDAGTRTLDLSTKHAKRVRLRSALHPRRRERAHARYIGARTKQASSAYKYMNEKFL